MRTSSRVASLVLALACSVSALPARADTASAPGASWLRPGSASAKALGAARPSASALRSRAQTSGAFERGLLEKVAPEARGTELLLTGVDAFGDGDRIARFAQLHRGLPVVGAGASVRVNGDDALVLAAVRLEADLPRSVEPTVTAEAAAAVARGELAKLGPFAAACLVSPERARLVIHRQRGDARLAWAVLPAVPPGVPASPRVLVDAQDGSVLEARDVALQATARMYASNPIKSPTLATLPFAISPEDAGGHLGNPFVKSLNCAGDGVVKSVSLQGLPLTLRSCELTQTALANSVGDFVYEPLDDYAAKPQESSSDAFSEVSMYFHTTRIYGFFRGLQGDPQGQVVVEKPLRAISNLRLDSALAKGDLGSLPGSELVPFSNAFYSPAGGGLGAAFAQLYGFDDGSLWFFQGPKRDYAYDGDVIYHEFTHAVVNATLKLEAWHLDAHGAVSAPGAMNEGLADYFSSALAGDPDVGEYASKDIAPGMNAIRTLANDDRCDNAVVGEVHADSTLFSGALWEARSSFATDQEKARFDAGVYKAMRTNPDNGDLGFEELGQLILTTLAADFPAGDGALKASMARRKILPACTRIRDYDGKAVRVPRSSGLPGFVSPGRSTVGVRTELAPGILQVKAPLPAGATSVKVSFKQINVGGGGGGGLFGGGGKPFAPVVLAKFGAPVAWTTSGKLAVDADGRANAVVAGSVYTATIEVPPPAEGATAADSVHVQIANAGDADGYYDELAVAVDVAPVTDDGRQPTTTPAAGTVTDPGSSKPQDGGEAGGCGCTLPGSSGHTAPSGASSVAASLVVALGGIVLMASRAAARRRRR